ncbi:MAG: hypothetical protein ACXVCY_13525 [Pseudobdellovibrionaceae bacterium]
MSLKLILVLTVAMTSISAQALNYDSEVPADIKTQMQADLNFMATLQGAGQTPLHKEIFGAVSGTAYKNFFETRIQSVGINACGSSMAVACVIPLADSHKMWLTQNFIKFNHPQIARMMVVYHESRHSEDENDNWSHDTCPVPFLDDQGRDMVSIWTGSKLAGQPACDSTAYGSYGSSTILLKNIAKYCSNCSDKVKMDADMYASDQLGRIDDFQVKKAMLMDFNAK